MRKIYFIIGAISLLFAAPAFASAATLALSPASGNFTVGNTFIVQIMLDTQGMPIEGVDIHYLAYDPVLLSVTDDDATVAGVQITPGSLMPNTAFNSVDATTGRISFSQVTSGSNTFTGAGTLATVHFRAIAAGTTAATIDFMPGSTTDANVTSGQNDILSSVVNGSYVTVALQPPTASAPKVFLSPATASFATGEAFTVNILVDTALGTIDGADITLNYNRSYVSVTDDDAATDGIQITPGALMQNTARNEVSSGKILFAQTTQGTETFTGAGTLATVHFRAIAAGSASLSFDFTQGRTTDTNLSFGGADILASVAGANITVVSNGLPPVLSNPQPSGSVSLSASVELSVATNEKATCRYATTAGVAYAAMTSSLFSSNGVTHTATVSSSRMQLGTNSFYVKCRDASGAGTQNDTLISFTGVTDNAPPIITNPTPSGSFFMPKNIHISVLPSDASGVASCKFGTTANIDYAAMTRYLYLHRLPPVFSTNDEVFSMLVTSRDLREGQNNFYVRCKDKTGNVNAIDTTVSFVLVAAPEFVVSAEGIANPSSTQFTVSLYQPGTTTPTIAVAARPDSTGHLPLSIDNTLGNTLVAPGMYDIAISADRHLVRKVNDIAVGSGTVIPMPLLLAGDLNNDGIVNSLDWSLMDADWGRSSSPADINRDARVNSVDWGFVRKNWMIVGDERQA